MDWRMKIYWGAVLISAIAALFLVRNLVLNGWSDLKFVSSPLLPVVLLLFSSSYLLLNAARKRRK